MVRRKKTTFILIVFVILFVVLLVRYVPILWGIFIDKRIDLTTTSEGNVNLLLMGIGGGNHDGPDLTDTIILANIQPDKKIVHLVSIPRDLYIKPLGSKINAAYADGQKKGKGILLSKSTVGAVTGIIPDYTVVLDFSGFVKLVDVLGGIDVEVKNQLDDYAYPVEGEENELCGNTQDSLATFSAQIATGSATEADLFPCRFTHLHVEKGTQHMDGKLALPFVRSRHAAGSEGTDFARSSRQQLVIEAVRNKLLSLGTISNPLKIFSIIQLLKQNINTDIPEDKFDDFIKLAQKMKGAQITSNVIDQGNTEEERYGLLVNPPLQDYNGQWVLAPRVGSNDYSEIQSYISCLIGNNICTITATSVETASPTPSVKPGKSL